MDTQRLLALLITACFILCLSNFLLVQHSNPRILNTSIFHHSIHNRNKPSHSSAAFELTSGATQALREKLRVSIRESVKSAAESRVIVLSPLEESEVNAAPESESNREKPSLIVRADYESSSSRSLLDLTRKTLKQRLRVLYYQPQDCMSESNATLLINRLLFYREHSHLVKDAESCVALGNQIQQYFESTDISSYCPHHVSGLYHPIPIDESLVSVQELESSSSSTPAISFKNTCTSIINYQSYECLEMFPFGTNFNFSDFGFMGNKTMPMDKFLQKYQDRMVQSVQTTIKQSWFTSSTIPRNACFVFHGNSMTRQVFQRLIFHLRHMPIVLEHYHHQNMWYAFDGEKDAWVIESFTDRSLQARGFQKENTLVLIFMFSSSSNLPATKRQNKFISNMIHINGSLAQNFHSGLTAPAWTFFRHTDDVAGAGNEFYASLDFNLMAYMRDNKEIGPKFPKRNEWFGSIKPQFKYNCTTLTEQFRSETHTDAHYQCGIERMFPEEIEYCKFPASGDCRDMLNFHVMQRFLQFQLDVMPPLS